MMKLQLILCFTIFTSISLVSQTPVKLSTDQFKFIEGPVWDGAEYIYFSDVAKKKIHKYSIKKNTFSLAFDNFEDGCNGLIFDKEYNLIIAGFKAGNIAKRKTDGTLINYLTTGFNNKRFDNPNDLCIDKNGGIYFTDPTRRKEPFQSARRIYYITPNRKITVADNGETYTFPNGVLISNDGTSLFVNDSDSHAVYKYTIDNATGKISNKSVFANLTNTNDGDNKSRADGMAIDTKGNLYITSKLTIQVFNKKGVQIKSIQFPEQVTNCTFSGLDKKTLYVTATKNLYAVEIFK